MASDTCCACGHQAHNGYNGQPCAECGNCTAIVISDRLDCVKPTEEPPQLVLFDIPSAGVTRTYRRRKSSPPASPQRSPQLALFAVEEVQ